MLRLNARCWRRFAGSVFLKPAVDLRRMVELRRTGPIRNRCHRLLGAALALGIFALTGPASAQPRTFTNPISPDGADPWVWRWQGAYFYTRTTGTDLRISRSADLTKLGQNDVSVWKPPEGTPYSRELWAPEVHRLDGKWYAYLAADGGKDADHRMYVLEGDSQDPQGHYTFKGQISVPADRWAIDGTVLEHKGKYYFVWSGRTFDDEADQSQSLYIAPMSNPWTLSGPRVKISSPDYEWERQGHPVNEGPEVLKSPGGRTFVIFSASGYYTPQYALGLLELAGGDPLDPAAWRKWNEPVFGAANGVEGTGHASFVPSPDDAEAWVVYHARRQADVPRDVRLGRFVFRPNGLPLFAPPTPTGEAAAYPSGTSLVTFVANGSFDRGDGAKIEDFKAYGDVAVAANDGGKFPKIEGGDGPNLALLGVGTDGALYQDVGRLGPGTYTLTAWLATGSDADAAVLRKPAAIVLRLEAVAVAEDGTPRDDGRKTLAEVRVQSKDLPAGEFKAFTVTGGSVRDSRAGMMLRVVVLTPDELSTPDAGWRVKLDRLSLGYDPKPAAPRR